MICIGIDVAKDKHDCYMINTEGEVLSDIFTISNNRKGFDLLLKKIQSVSSSDEQIKVGIEATGHYSYNILGFLLDTNLQIFVINPLLTNQYRKSLSLRKTKTDLIDARTIATKLMSDVELKPYTNIAYHNEELKSLTHYRFEKVKERAKLKTSVCRLVNITFPELETLVSTLHQKSIYTLLSKFPSASCIASAHLTTLTNLLLEASHGRHGKSKAEEIREKARASIGTSTPAKILELKHSIRAIQELSMEIQEIEAAIQNIMDEISSPMMSIPGVNYTLASMIVAEIGDFKNSESPDKILAYAGLSPTTYQSGKKESTHVKMEKRGSKYLRYTLFNATKHICRWDKKFSEYLAKKRSEGKHYYVALSHAAKKLVQLIYAPVKTQQSYCTAS